MDLKIPPPKNIASKKNCYDVTNGEEGKCSTGLGLNIELSQHGDNHEYSSYSKFNTSGYGFTFLERQELEQQFFIYNYIEAGIPVPSHLIIPIFKSITCSVKGLQYVTGYDHLDWELKSNMEAEPRRCKRTDGKKWRCSRNVVQNRKYCERHMHRGCQRPKKHVELTSSNLQLSTSTIKSSSKMEAAAKAHQNSEPDTNSFSIALPIN